MSVVLKITCNPYTKKITYKHKAGNNSWSDITPENPLFKCDGRVFSEISNEVVKEIFNQVYPNIEFEGTDDDYAELEYAIKTVPILEKQNEGKKISLKHSGRFQEAEDVLPLIEKEFKEVLSSLDKNKEIKNAEIKSELEKFKETVKDEIPIVVMGTYSSGKSAFINSLIGYEILPSGIETTTTKTHRIKKSASCNSGKISFIYDGENVTIDFSDNDFKVDTKSRKAFCVNLKRDIKNIYNEHEKTMGDSIECHMYQVLEFLNKKGTEACFSDLLEIEVPSNKGIFSDEDTNFVILDTPGSDSVTKETEKKHNEILKDALNSQTNGLPIFVTKGDNANSTANKEILDEMEKNNLDKGNMLIIVNKADDLSDGDIKTLATGRDVIHDFQSTRIFFVSSIMGLAGQKKNFSSFYNEAYNEYYEKNKDMFINAKNQHYKELYKNNIMPEPHKERIEKSADKSITDGNETELLYANSGIQCVVEEILSYGEKLALYNKCARARDYLESALKIVIEKINEKEEEKKAPEEEIERKLEKTKKKLIEKIKDKANEFSAKIINDYEKDLNIKINNHLNEKIETIKSWSKKYGEEFNSKVKEKGTDLLSVLKGNVKKDDLFTGNEKSKKNRVKKVVGSALEAATLLKDSVNDSSTGKKQIRGEIIEDAEKDLYGFIMENRNAICEDSKEFYDNKDSEIRDYLIAVATNKAVSELAEDEKQKVVKGIQEFPELSEELNSKVSLQDVQVKHIPLLKYIDFGNFNVTKLKAIAKTQLKEFVLEQAEKIKNEHTEIFKKWKENLVGEIEEKITALNSTLADLSSRKEHIEKELRILNSIREKISNSEKNLDKYFSVQ